MAGRAGPRALSYADTGILLGLREARDHLRRGHLFDAAFTLGRVWSWVTPHTDGELQGRADQLRKEISEAIARAAKAR